MLWNVYDIRENKCTNNFNGYELIIDGERGFDTFPGKWDLSEAKQHYMQGLPWYEPLKNIHTCIINLDGSYYALGHDLFMTTIYAIGPDRKEGKQNTIYYINSEGRRDDRNAAIRSVCIPHDWKTAYDIARAGGIYDGQLIAEV